MFSSDNGGLSYGARGKTPRNTGRNTHCWPLKAGKGSAYEGGTRVPMIVSWARPNAVNPRQKKIPIAAASICDAPNICEDYFPTLCNWAGISDQLAGREDIDGRDLTADVTGKPPKLTRPLLFHYPHVWGPRFAGRVRGKPTCARRSRRRPGGAAGGSTHAKFHSTRSRPCFWNITV